MTAHLDHFALATEPFSKEIDDKDLWLPPSKQSLVDEILEAIECRENVVLSGEPGVGKTCVLRAVRHRVDSARYRMTYCHNATLGRRDFYRQLCLALGLRPSATAAAVFWAVSTHVEELAKERSYPIFLLDEAHLLHQDTLDHLHILLNYQWDSKALLSLVLVGLTDLDELLRLRRNRSLYSRMHRRLVLDPLTPDDTADYLRMRIRRAGVDRDLFADDAASLVHEAASGTLRELDRLATTCLRHAARRKKKSVDRDVVSRVLKSVDSRDHS
jgi:type II secretory pathway predicted ATPase ExeA